MTTRKKFDCVEMKWKIQQKLDAEYAGMPDGEARKRQDQKLRRNPLMKG
jgi:hypothetical protein